MQMKVLLPAVWAPVSDRVVLNIPRVLVAPTMSVVYLSIAGAC